MSDLTKANAARLDLALDKLWTFRHGIDSFRNCIAQGKFSHAEIGETPSVKWDRRKFNRMDHKQQAEYQRKLDTMVPEYRLYWAGCSMESYSAVTKSILEYFNTTATKQ